MAISTSSVTVGTTPTPLNAGADGITSVALKAPSSATVYVGGSNVSASNGWPVDAGEKESFDLERFEVLYAVVSSGSAAVTVLVSGL